jgi:hypothetical protein
VVLALRTDCQKAAAASEVSALLVADGNIRIEKSRCLEILGVAALKTELTDLNDPVEVGKKVIYQMSISNTGSAPVSRIEVKGIVPDLMKAVGAKGPTRATITGPSIAFDKVDILQPGAKIRCLFECEALKAGDVRFRVEYTSDLNETPIFEEESTHIIEPFGPGGAVSKAPEARVVVAGADKEAATEERPALSAEEERLQRFWHDYYDALGRYNRTLARIDWVAYYKNHGVQIGGDSNRVRFAPVFVTPQLNSTVPSSLPSSPPPIPVAPSSAY